jgi:hypothetical protein
MEAVLVLFKFASNQLFITINFEDFFSSIPAKKKLFINSHPNEFLLLVVEVYLRDEQFLLVNYDFHTGYFFRWVKGVALIAFIVCSRLASLTVSECDANAENIFLPRNPLEG